MSIVLYGATGYTGRLVARELARRGLDFTLSGRSAERLRRLADEERIDAPVRAASIDDERALRELLGDARVVVDCAGPFTRLGEPVVRAAIDTGTHFVDSTGEQGYMRMVFERYGEPAERKGVALVPALGFDYVPGDCAARIAADGLEPLEEVVVAYAASGVSATRGTLRSVLEVMRGDDVVYEDGDWRPAPSAPSRARFEFPEPLGRTPVVRYPSGEVLTVPRHTRVRRVRSFIGASTFVPHDALAPLLGVTMPALGAALRTPLHGVLDRAIDRLPEGPSDDDRRASRYLVVAEARAADGGRRRTVVRGTDVYGITAVMLAHGAELMLAEGYDRAGALGPAAAYDPRAFLNHLGDHGLSWSVDPAAPVAEPAPA
jgi:short subunit dehydrogenase-like uncharacterized protein